MRKENPYIIFKTYLEKELLSIQSWEWWVWYNPKNKHFLWSGHSQFLNLCIYARQSVTLTTEQWHLWKLPNNKIKKNDNIQPFLSSIPLYFLVIFSLMTKRLIRHHVNVANDFQGFSMIALQDRNLYKEIKV